MPTSWSRACVWDAGTCPREQRRDLIAQSLRQDPQLSNREHARRTGANDKTVATVRAPLEATAEIPQSAVRLSG